MDFNIDLNKLISPNFRQAFLDILKCDVNEAILKGGRASTKTVTSSYAVILGCMMFNASALCVMETGNNVEGRFVNAFLSNISRLGLDKFWKHKKSPYHELILLDNKGKTTNHSIKFLGAHDPERLKGIIKDNDVYRYLFVEELTNFNSYQDVLVIMGSVLRGHGKQCMICAYNPPLSRSSWTNELYNKPVGKILGYDSDYYYEDYEYEVGKEIKQGRRLIHHSTLYDIIDFGHPEWLGDQPRIAAMVKQDNNKFWRWAYCGEPDMSGDAAVLYNIKDWDGDESKLDINTIDRGLDFGYGGPDATCGGNYYYDEYNKRLYILDEFYGSKMSIDTVADNIRKLNPYNFPVYADSAVPLLISQLVSRGLEVLPVKKYPGSVEAGVRWLQSLSGIYINRNKTPNHYRELSGYSYLVDKYGNVTHQLSGENDHSIAAIRYGCYNHIPFD